MKDPVEVTENSERLQLVYLCCVSSFTQLIKSSQSRPPQKGRKMGTVSSMFESDLRPHPHPHELKIWEKKVPFEE